jgi:dihydroorotase
VTILDLDSRYQVTNTFLSKASNSPFIGETVHGRVIGTIVGGVLRYDEREAVAAPAVPSRPKKKTRR